MSNWPTTAGELIEVQEDLHRQNPPPWNPRGGSVGVGGCFVCFIPGSSPVGSAGDPGWSGAAIWQEGKIIATSATGGTAGAPYEPGLLALREGPLLEAAVRELPSMPDVLLVNGTGMDHPRRAGLALHLGAILDVPTVGVTNRSLVARGEQPGEMRGDASPLYIDEEQVAMWLRVQTDVHPVVVHPAWRTSLTTASELVLSVTFRARTPEPLRQARQAARVARATDKRRAGEMNKPTLRGAGKYQDPATL
ncbi:MAG: endonuclease V [Fidelibacterota bacterium]|nr:MAG: endonuclease V [Candidatus Neomarinimicrobiota bacterium]